MIFYSRNQDAFLLAYNVTAFDFLKTLVISFDVLSSKNRCYNMSLYKWKITFGWFKIKKRHVGRSRWYFLSAFLFSLLLLERSPLILFYVQKILMKKHYGHPKSVFVVASRTTAWRICTRPLVVVVIVFLLLCVRVNTRATYTCL